MMNEQKLTDNLLAISWHDSAWIPILSPHNVMDYFSERSNPFYDRTCNNEVLKMQRQSMDQLHNLQGVEYCLLHVQEPILYVVRKQHRISTTHVTPISDYYIVAGTVYQAPDLGSVLNSRILTTVTHLQSAFEEARTFSRYHPSKGYWWDFGKKDLPAHKVVGAAATATTVEPSRKKKNTSKDDEKKARQEPSSLFQRRRVDMLLDLLTRQFPPKQTAPVAPAAAATNAKEKLEASADVKSEKDAPASGAASVKSERLDVAGIKREASLSGSVRAPDSKKSKLG